jgi:hypothetical protein
MLTLERQTAKLVNLNARAEKHGEENIPAADLHFSFDASNDLLSEFDPALKSSLYRKPDANGDQGELLDQPGWLPKLRFPAMSAFKWEIAFKDATLTVHAPRKSIVLSPCDIDQFKFEPRDGGSVILSFRAVCHPDETQVGKLYNLIQKEVEISLVDPLRNTDAQQQLAQDEKLPDDWPFPEDGTEAGAAPPPAPGATA